MLSVKCGKNGCWDLCFLWRVDYLSLKEMSLMWLITWLWLYPLSLSLCITFSLSELVLKYGLVSPFAIALMVEGGWYDVE